MTTFYAWAIPANIVGSWADHTWVTTFDNRVNPCPSLPAVVAAHESLWMCWGSFHPQGGTPTHANGLLGSAAGDLNYARCLVLDNTDSVHIPPARGTIQKYGFDGVCHQVANQVLYATISGTTPLTVNGARGYTKSVYVYGQYGRAHAAWAAKKQSCGASLTTGPDTTAMDVQDDFEAQAQRVLVDRSDLYEALLALRARHQIQQENLRLLPEVSPEAINIQHKQQMDEIASLIGSDRFLAIFRFEPGEAMNLVDPAIFEVARRAPPG